MSARAGVRDECWVWLPRDREGTLQPAAFELLSEARGLCRRLEASLVCWSDRDLASAELDQLGAWGVNETRSLGRALDPHPILPQGSTPLPTDRLPRAFLFADDTAGRVLAPLWVAETGATLITGATGVTCDPAHFVAARPILGEQYEALVSVNLDVPIAVNLVPGSIGTVSPPAAPPHKDEAAARPLAREAPEAARILTPDPATLDVADAERIVAFGRGAFSPEAIRLVEELAALLGATVAGSRPAADEGWIPFARQVGLTGAIVRPRLYVAVGISGAPYHMVGVKDPETLIAINRDPEAPIFGAAHLGIVGDLYQVLPELIARLKRGQAPQPLQAAAPAGRRA